MAKTASTAVFMSSYGHHTCYHFTHSASSLIIIGASIINWQKASSCFSASAANVKSNALAVTVWQPAWQQSGVASFFTHLQADIKSAAAGWWRLTAGRSLISGAADAVTDSRVLINAQYRYFALRRSGMALSQRHGAASWRQAGGA